MEYIVELGEDNLAGTKVLKKLISARAGLTTDSLISAKSLMRGSRDQGI